MTKIRFRWSVLAACMLAALSVSTRASVDFSDRMGVYCIVDKVVLEPEGSAAERAQIHGTCAQADMESWYFEAPAKGYYYYAAPKNQEAAAVAEWTDIKSTAGTGTAIGFGRRYHTVGKMRAATEAPGKPDTYPIHFGVVKVTGRAAPEVMEVIAKLKAKKAEADVKKGDVKKAVDVKVPEGTTIKKIKK